MYIIFIIRKDKTEVFFKFRGINEILKSINLNKPNKGDENNNRNYQGK